MATPRYSDPRRLLRYGAKAYSQNDEDGILAEIFRRIGASGRRSSKSDPARDWRIIRLTLLLQGWRGLWIDSDDAIGGASKGEFRNVYCVRPASC